MTPDTAKGVLDIAWTDEFSSGVYPVSQYRTPSGEVAEVHLDYPCKVSRFPVTFAQFHAYLTDTGTRSIVGFGLPEPSGKPLTCVYCTEVLPFCRWLNQQYQAHGWLEAGWRIDLPLTEEWVVAVNRLWGEREEPVSQFTTLHGIVLFEWCWRTAAYAAEEGIPKGGDDWTVVMKWFNSCLTVRTRIHSSDVYPTWDDNHGFRVACRRMT